MSTLKHYWLRFVSDTPKALKRLQALMAAIAVASASALAIMTQFAMNDTGLLSIFKYMAVAAAFAVPMLQFATSDRTLQNNTPKDV